jgi:hypothetical protein
VPLLWKEGEGLTVIYVAYDEECCEGFKSAMTPVPHVEYFDDYFNGMDEACNKYDEARVMEEFKKKYLKQLRSYEKSSFFEQIDGYIMLLKDAGNEFYFDVLLGFLERNGFQIRVIRKGQERL